ncbi:hypothetical protein ACYPKM_04305 [Pseudomonas aeruginosa]
MNKSIVSLFVMVVVSALVGCRSENDARVDGSSAKSMYESIFRMRSDAGIFEGTDMYRQIDTDIRILQREQWNVYHSRTKSSEVLAKNLDGLSLSEIHILAEKSLSRQILDLKSSNASAETKTEDEEYKKEIAQGYPRLQVKGGVRTRIIAYSSK